MISFLASFTIYLNNFRAKGNVKNIEILITAFIPLPPTALVNLKNTHLNIAIQ